MVKGVPVISSRTRDTTMLGEVPICVIRPPSSEAKAIGIRKVDGEVLGAARELEGDRDHDRQRADVLHEGRQHGDRRSTSSGKLGAHRGKLRRVALEGEFHDAAASDARR